MRFNPVFRNISIIFETLLHNLILASPEDHPHMTLTVCCYTPAMKQQP
jgi:hypothetical protein